jgi:hypothetical protein
MRNATANTITNQTHNINSDNNKQSQIDLKLYGCVWFEKEIGKKEKYENQ